MSLFSSSPAPTLFALILGAVFFTLQSEATASPSGMNDPAIIMHRQLSDRDYSDSMTVYQLDLSDSLPYEPALEQILAGRIANVYPRPDQQRTVDQIIFGDDRSHSGLTSIKPEGFFLAFIRDGRCRTVTGRLSTDQQTGWLIEKVWTEQPGGPADIDVGFAHNQALDFLLADGNDKVVRKKPGRSGSPISLTEYVNDLPGEADTIAETCYFLQTTYPEQKWLFTPVEQLGRAPYEVARDYDEYRAARSRLELNKRAQAYLDQLDQAILRSRSRAEFEVALMKLNRRLNQHGRGRKGRSTLNRGEVEIVRGAISLARGSVYFWAAYEDVFDADVRGRGKGGFWADLGGFLSGALTAGLDGNPDTGVIETGVELGVFASAVASLLDDDEDD